MPAPLKGAIASWLILLLAAPGTAATIQLTNGSQIEANIIKETDRQLFLDLGFTVLPVPKERVKAVTGRETVGDPAPNVARFFGPPRGAAPTDTSVDRLYRVASARQMARLKKLNASAVVKQYNNSVVVVSAGKGWGTGFIIDKRGYLITNHHVIAGEEEIGVSLLVQDGTGKVRSVEFKTVTIVADNRYLDLALLKLDEKKLKPFNIQPVLLAEMDQIHKGDTVFAIGNPGLGKERLSHTVSEGIVSSLARNINGLPYLQTTAAVNPGNSGGPLFNNQGLVIGVVTLKASYQEGIAFALPTTYVVDFIRNREAFAYKKDEDKKEEELKYLDPPKRAKPEADKPADDAPKKD